MNHYTQVAFTICSNNYLGQALALKKSFLEHNPSFGFFIVLVDKLSDEIDYSVFLPAQIIPIDKIKSVNLEDLISRYYIIELNTSVKPSVFKYLIANNPEVESIFYLDPDLYFYSSLNSLNAVLQSKVAVLTPHILSPIPRDGKQPDENTFFRFGIYNLGFLGVNAKHKESKTLLDWWEERVINFGYDRPNKGYFVDQLWMTIAPLFFNEIAIENSYGYNMAPWNLHERHILSRDGDTILLNDNSPLVFYHFSKIAEDKDSVSREYDRFSLQDFPLLKELYLDYKMVLSECRFSEYKKIPIAFPVKIPPTKKASPKKASLFSKGLSKLSNLLNQLAKKV